MHELHMFSFEPERNPKLTRTYILIKLAIFEVFFIITNAVKMSLFAILRALEQKVRNLMREKQDYKGWYYVPVPKEAYELKEKFNKETGSKGYDPKFTK